MLKRLIPSGNPHWDRTSVKIGLCWIALVIVILGLTAHAMCGCSTKSDDLVPISNRVSVDGVVQEVHMRHWCGTDNPCEPPPILDANLLVQPDGSMKVVRDEKEFLFKRGNFVENRVNGNGGWFWVANSEGNYLLATDGDNRAYIIYHPAPNIND